MSTATKAKLNGSSKTTAIKQNPGVSPKENLITVPVKPPMTLEDRLRHATELKALVDKRAIFVRKRNEIREFSFGSDEHASQIVLQDDSGKSFSTGNGYVVKELTKYLETLITGKISELDAQVMNFEV